MSVAMSVCTSVQVRGESTALYAKKNIIVSLSPSYRALPGFHDVSRSEQQSLFFRKLELCSVVFDFGEPSKNAKEKKTKRLALEEIVKYLEAATNEFTEDLIQEVVKMVSANLFSSRVRCRKENQVIFEVFGSDDSELFMDPSWPHLELVYEFFLKFLKSRRLDTRLAMKYVDSSFIRRLLDLFDSEDPRERECLKGVLHCIYTKFPKHQPFVKKAIENILYEFIYETKKHNGIAELLEILGSIIAGFISPLKEHKLFLVRVLLPLHKSSAIKTYHQQLCHCVMQFVEKDLRLAETVIRGLLKYWPITNSSKEVMFLQELEEVLEAMSLIEFDRCMIPLSRQIARCLDNSHYQVAERVLSLWKNYHIERLMEENMESILPVLYPSLKRNARQHWNRAIQRFTRDVIHIFSYHDHDLFKDCVRVVEENRTRDEKARSKREATWQRLEEIAASRAIHDNVIPTSQQAY